MDEQNSTSVSGGSRRGRFSMDNRKTLEEVLQQIRDIRKNGVPQRQLNEITPEKELDQVRGR